RGDFRMLFPGGAEQQELGWWMATAPGLLRADVLKAGHHGSDNSTSADVLDVVQPRAVIISANGRQHPFADVLALLDARGIPTYCTADAGTVTVRVPRDRKSTRLNSSHGSISYAVFCLTKKKNLTPRTLHQRTTSKTRTHNSHTL